MKFRTVSYFSIFFHVYSVQCTNITNTEPVFGNLLRSPGIDSQPGGPERQIPDPVFLNLLRSPGIDSQPGRPVRQPYTDKNITKFYSSEGKGTRSLLVSLYMRKIFFSLLSVYLSHRPPGYIGWRNRFLISINVYKYGLCI